MQLLLKHEDQLQSIAKQDCFIFFHHAGRSRDPTHPSQGDSHMDASHAVHHSTEGTLEADPGQDHLRHPDRTSPKDCQHGHQLCSVATDHQHAGHSPGRELALSQLEPCQKQIGNQSNEEEPARHEDPYGAFAGDQGTTLPTELSSPCASIETTCWRRHDPVEDADWLERDDSLRSALQTHLLQHVATTSDDDAAAQCKENQHSHNHSATAELERHGSTSLQGEGQGQAQTLFLMEFSLTFDKEAARQKLLLSRMANPAAWCYLNATITGLLWLLLADPPEEAQLSEIWGPQAKAWFLVLGACNSDKPVSLFDLVALQPLMQYWDTQPHQQCCAAEFLLRVLEWSQLPLLDHSWEQRVLQGSQVEIFEKGGEHCLLTFNWIEELDMEHVQLADCIWSWALGAPLRHAFGLREQLTIQMSAP